MAVGVNASPEIPDTAIYYKPTNNAKSDLVEYFSDQALWIGSQVSYR